MPDYEVIPDFPHVALGPLVFWDPTSSYALPFDSVVSATLPTVLWPCQIGICLRAFACGMPFLCTIFPPVTHKACVLTSFISLLKCHVPVRPSLISLLNTDLPYRHTLCPHFLLYFLHNNIEHHLTVFDLFPIFNFLECNLHEGTDFCQCCSLLDCQHLEQCLADSSKSLNICWMKYLNYYLGISFKISFRANIEGITAHFQHSRLP